MGAFEPVTICAWCKMDPATHEHEGDKLCEDCCRSSLMDESAEHGHPLFDECQTDDIIDDYKIVGVV